MAYERISFYSEYLAKVVTIIVQDETVYRLTLDEPHCEEQPDRGAAATQACQAYLAGENVDLQRYPVHLEGLTSFEHAVLRATRRIPRGHVTTYSALAAQIGRPSAARAVGNALAKNPIPLFIPCHRVIRKESIGGFSCGLDVKVKLLELEGVSSL
ncbi:MAG: methylated-DNA--[protein]-cysteine S-methyltransferase [Halobacteriota archaeon]